MFVLLIVFIYQRLGELAASTGKHAWKLLTGHTRRYPLVVRPHPGILKKLLTPRDFSSAGNFPGSAPVLPIEFMITGIHGS
jgi:hypothetical protein